MSAHFQVHWKSKWQMGSPKDSSFEVDHMKDELGLAVYHIEDQPVRTCIRDTSQALQGHHKLKQLLQARK